MIICQLFTFRLRGDVDVGEVLHQQHLLRLLGRHQLGVLVSAGGQGLLQLGLLLVQRGHVGVILLLGDPGGVVGISFEARRRVAALLRVGGDNITNPHNRTDGVTTPRVTSPPRSSELFPSHPQNCRGILKA